jgi:hypothetical protein
MPTAPADVLGEQTKDTATGWTNNRNFCLYDPALAGNALLGRATGTRERLLPHWQIWIGVDQNLRSRQRILIDIRWASKRSDVWSGGAGR